MISKYFFGKLNLIALAFLTFTLCACASQPLEKEAAVLTSNSEQTRSEIINFIRQSLGGKNIPIAENIFQETSRLLLGKTSGSASDGIKVIHANQKSTIIFELVKQGDNCILRRLNTPQQWLLTTKACVKR